MRIKLDENLPTALVGVFARQGHDADTVRDEGLSGRDDDTVWKAAQQTGRFLVTQDLDFSDIRQFQPGTHHGILLLRLRDPGRRAIVRRIEGIIAIEAVSDWEGCFVVATDRKIRVRRPPP